MINDNIELFLNFSTIWLPWYNFIDDVWVIQFLIIYILWLFYSSKNIYYSLLYLLFLIFFFGLTLSIIQMELFTGFLWVVEFTVILIILILFFYLNVEGTHLKTNLKTLKLYYLFFFFFFLFTYSLKTSSYELYSDTPLNWLLYDFILDDWYEATNNYIMNDFMVLTLGYYSINNVEFLLIGIILFIGSIICVVLNKTQKLAKYDKTSFFLNFFSFFSDFLNYSFLRKQDLNSQTNYTPNIRIFKKKKWL